MKKIIEAIDPAELTVEAIRARAVAFNTQFEALGGYKGYEAQAVDVLLAEIGNLEAKCIALFWQLPDAMVLGDIQKTYQEFKQWRQSRVSS